MNAFIMIEDADGQFYGVHVSYIPEIQGMLNILREYYGGVDKAAELISGGELYSIVIDNINGVFSCRAIYSDDAYEDREIIYLDSYEDALLYQKENEIPVMFYYREDDNMDGWLPIPLE